MVKQKLNFIAEIGINHNGDFDLARKHIDAAKEAGATTVKMQNYYAETRVPKDSPIFSILKDCELPPEKIHDLKLYSESLKINFADIGVSAKDFSTVVNERMNIESANLCIEAKQKKPEFGGAKIFLKNYRCEGKISTDRYSLVSGI